MPTAALHVYPDEDGTVRVRGRLSAEMGALLVKAWPPPGKLYIDAGTRPGARSRPADHGAAAG